MRWDLKKWASLIFDVSTDTENELSKRIDGIISSLQFNDLVFVQLPTGNR